MSKKTQKPEVESTEPKTVKREVEAHSVPLDYNGRGSNGPVYSAFPSYGGKLPVGETLHTFEIRLPLARDLTEFEQLYGYTPEQAIERLTKAIWTDMDGEVKSVLFAGIESPLDAYTVGSAAHIAAQRKADEWRYTPRTGGSKKTTVDSVVATLVAAGVLTADAAAEIKTAADLERAIAGLNR